MPNEIIRLIILVILSFGITCCGCALFLNFFFKKFNSKPAPTKYAVIFFLTHFILVNILAIFIYNAMKNNYEMAMTWVIFIFMDAPISFILFSLLKNLVEGLSPFFMNFTLPYLIFAIFGSIQYFFYGYLIGKIINAIKKMGKNRFVPRN
jgi:hypothetical protein